MWSANFPVVTHESLHNHCIIYNYLNITQIHSCFTLFSSVLKANVERNQGVIFEDKQIKFKPILTDQHILTMSQ